MAKTYRDLNKQLDDAERDIIEAMNRTVGLDSSNIFTMMPLLVEEYNQKKRNVEQIIAKIEKTKQAEKKLLKSLQKKYKKKFTAADLLQILTENDQTNTEP
jgi:DNA-binding NarL/FixJ family response regulator